MKLYGILEGLSLPSESFLFLGVTRSRMEGDSVAFLWGLPHYLIC